MNWELDREADTLEAAKARAVFIELECPNYQARVTRAVGWDAPFVVEIRKVRFG